MRIKSKFNLLLRIVVTVPLIGGASVASAGVGKRKKWNPVVSGVFGCLLALATFQPDIAVAQVESSSGEADALTEIIVQGRRFRVDDTSSSTKLDQRVAETAQPVTVFDEKLFKDLGLRDFTEALPLVPGVSNPGNWGGQITIIARGYDVPAARINGLWLGTDRMIDNVAVQQLEFVRGGSGATYGEGGPGGFTNILTRQPETDLRFEASAEVGSYDFKRIEGVATGPLTSSGALRFFIGAAAEDRETYTDFENFDRRTIYGVLEADVGSRLNFKVTGYYSDANLENLSVAYPLIFNRDPTLPGNPVTSVEFPTDLPISAYAGADWNLEENDQFFAQAEVNFDVTDTFALQLAAGTTESNRWANVLDPCCEVDPDGITGGYDSHFGGVTEVDYFELRAKGEFNTNQFNLQYLATIEHQENSGTSNFNDYTFLGPFDIYNPSYDYPQPEAGLSRDEWVTFARLNESEITSASVVGIGTIMDKTTITLGARYDDYDLTRSTFSDYQQTLTSQRNTPGDTTSYRASIMHEVATDTRVYYSYAETFETNFGQTCDGTPPPPETGTVHELGIKAEFFERRLLATVSIYDIETEDNVVRLPADACLPLQNPVTLGSGSQAQGGEIEINGKVSDSWSMLASYAYTDAEAREGEDEPFRPTPNVAPHQVTLFTVYDILDGRFQGLGFGGGFTYLSERDGTFSVNDQGVRLKLDDQLRANAAIYYRPTETWSFSLNIKNIFDSEDIESPFQAAGFVNRWMEPRTWYFRTTLQL